MCSKKVSSGKKTGSSTRFLLLGGSAFVVVGVPLLLWSCSSLFTSSNNGRTDELVGKNEGRYKPLYEAAKLVRPERQQINFFKAGFSSFEGKPDAKHQFSSLEKKKFIDAYKKATTQEVKATILPGFGRQRNYEAMPLIIDAVKSQSIVLSGRAIATAESLLGVRYEVSMSQLREQSYRKKLSNMVAEDWENLKKFPRFSN